MNGKLNDGVFIMGKKQRTKLQHALNYSEKLGWAVLPCHYMVNVDECSCGEQRKADGTFNCSAGKHPVTTHGLNDATKDKKQIKKWWSDNPDYNIGVRTGEESNLFVVDVDLKNDGLENIKKVCQKHGSLGLSVRAKTGSGGKHILYSYPKDGMKRGNSSGSFPEGIDIRGEGGYIVVSPSNHESGKQYKWENDYNPWDVELEDAPDWVLNLVDAKPSNGVGSSVVPQVIKDGSRNNTIYLLGCSLRAKGLGVDAIKAALNAENLEKCNPPLGSDEIESLVKQVCKHEAGSTASTENWRQKQKEKEEGEIISLGFVIPEGNKIAKSDEAEVVPDNFPKKAKPETFYGPTGKLINWFEPNTECDPMALYTQFLSGLGNIVGTKVFCMVEGTKQKPNVFINIAGSTSESRKGTSLRIVQSWLKYVDPVWFENNVFEDISTGEGIIHTLRDEVKNKVKLTDKNKPVEEIEFTPIESDGNYSEDNTEDEDEKFMDALLEEKLPEEKPEKTKLWGRNINPDEDISDNGIYTDSTGQEWIEEVTDPGVPDKRAWFVMEEFGRFFNTNGRSGGFGNADTVRSAFDSGNLKNSSKNSNEKVTNPHISIVGHITPQELSQKLNIVDCFNGLLNRFMFFCVKRQRYLPLGKKVDEKELHKHLDSIISALNFVKGLPGEEFEIKLSEKALKEYGRIYRKQNHYPTVLKSLICRSTTQILRVAMTHAVMDHSRVIKKKHIKAADALWDYSEQSCKFLFGDIIGNIDADRLLIALMDADNGMTDGDIGDFFKRNLNKTDLETIKQMLVNFKLVFYENIQYGKNNKKSRRWFHISKLEQKKSDIKSSNSSNS